MRGCIFGGPQMATGLRKFAAKFQKPQNPPFSLVLETLLPLPLNIEWVNGRFCSGAAFALLAQHLLPQGSRSQLRVKTTDWIFASQTVKVGELLSCAGNVCGLGILFFFFCKAAPFRKMGRLSPGKNT